VTIVAVCNSCGKRFQAPPEFVGKRVKCKGCGVVFEIQAPLGSKPSEAGGVDLDALAALEQSFSGDVSADTRAGRSKTRPGVRSDPQPAEETSDDDAMAVLPYEPAGRANVLKFHYPGAKQVDQWLPLGLVVFSVLGLGVAAAQQETGANQWIAFVRFLFLSLLYVVLIFPFTMAMLRKVGAEQKFEMPPQEKLRCFACYIPSFALAAGLWFAGDGVSVMQAFGALFGLAISSTAVWLLYRLREEEIANTIAYGAGGFALGSGISVGLILGLNLLVGQIVVQQKAQDKVPLSPFGPGLSWVSPKPSPAPVVEVRPKPAPAVPTPTSPQVTPPPTPPVATSLVTNVESGLIPAPITEIVQPLSTNPIVGIVRYNNNAVFVEPWSTATWHQQAGALQLPTRPNGGFVISTDGQSLAWISDFPRLSVQVWSITDGRVISTIDLDRSLGDPLLIGFTSPNRLLIQWSGAYQSATPAPAPTPVNPATPVTPATIPAPLPPPPPAERPHKHSVFDDFPITPGNMANDAPKPEPTAPTPPTPGTTPPLLPPVAASPEDLKSHTLQVRDVKTGGLINFAGPLVLGSNSAPITPFSISTRMQRLIIAEKAGDTPTLLQFDLNTGVELPRIKIAGVLDPSMPAIPTGLTYSGDAKSVAILFEHNGSALLLNYDTETGTKKLEAVYPVGPLDGAAQPQFTGNTIAWLDPSGFLLVDGKGFIDLHTGTHLKGSDLTVSNVIAQRVMDDDRIELICGDAGNTQITVVTIDRSKLESLAPDATR
jgi:hypothetical protein